MPSLSLASVKQSATRPVANSMCPKSSLNDGCVIDVCFPEENRRIFPIGHAARSVSSLIFTVEAKGVTALPIAKEHRANNTIKFIF